MYCISMYCALYYCVLCCYLGLGRVGLSDFGFQLQIGLNWFSDESNQGGPTDRTLWLCAYTLRPHSLDSFWGNKYCRLQSRPISPPPIWFINTVFFCARNLISYYIMADQISQITNQHIKMVAFILC